LIKSIGRDQEPSRSAAVIAASGGEDYNIPAGTRLEITNQVFGGQPQVLYAKTETALVGGNSRFLSVITEEDIANAKTTLTKNALDQIATALAQKQLVLLEQAYETEVVDYTTDQPAGKESPSFQAQLTLHVRGLVFNSDTLRQLIRARVSGILTDQKELQAPELDKLTYKVKNIDAVNRLMNVTVHYESQALGTLALDDVVPQLLGKSKEQASTLLLLQPAIERVDIILSPRWQTSLPRFVSKVKIEVKQ
jgi:hypothetical protein